MPRFRILSIVISLLLITFTVRVGDFAVELLRGEPAVLKPSEAHAEEVAAEKPKKEGADAKKDDKSSEKKDGKDKPEREEIPAKTGVVTSTTEVKGMEQDPFSPEYSDEEIKVLQNLSKRREQIDQREHDLDQREKLLQAAEKKVDQKVEELEKLKTNIEGLLDKQNKLQAANVAQLVKIYANMKPKDAANIFNDMDFDVLLGIVSTMPERKVSPILAAMDPIRAREVSARIAEDKSLPKKMETPPAAQ